MTDEEDRVEKALHDHWKRKAQEADRRLRDLNAMLYTARAEARKPDATAMSVGSKLTMPTQVYLDEVRSEGWEEHKRRPVEKNPYKGVRLSRDH